jgi:ABC-type transport system involved in multi-copper enzyme maturation permease subunit
MPPGQESVMHWGLGPVFIYECLTTSRRWQTYAGRCFGVSVLLAAMTTIAWSKNAMLAVESMQEYAQLGESYFDGLIGIELTLVMLAAPAATAGAICLDRSRGTLAHMLATDLSDSEIVLGKLASRLLPVLGLVACSWPVLAIASLLGGIDPFALTLAFAVIIAVAVVGCSMALALSVWARKPHEVVLVTYTFWIFVLMLSTIWTGLSWSGLVRQPPAWADLANPFYLAFVPYANPGAVGFWEYLGFFAVTLGASVALAVLAIWRMRSVACRAGGENGKGGLGRLGRLTRWMPGPSLDGNPVLWREWRRSRPSPWMVILLLLVGGSTGIACAVGTIDVWYGGVVTPGTMPARAVLAGIVGYELQVIFGLLMLSAMAPMSMSEEHQRGSLDILAATPLSSRTIVLGKWWGTFRLVPFLAIGPGLMAFALATAQEPPPTGRRAALTFSESEMTLGYRLFGAALVVATILAHGAAATSVGLALAIWIKRQSRAIAISIGLFVLVAVGWPFLVLVLGGGGPDDENTGLGALSPIFCTGFIGSLLAIRMVPFRSFCWWAAFWVVEVTLLAFGTLWLSIQSFDRSFGRMPARARASTVLPWVITIAIACAAMLIANWAFGIILAFNPDPAEAGTIFSFVALMIGELLIWSLMALALASIRRRERRGGKAVPIDS